MKVSLCVIAVLAGVSTAAVAQDLKQAQKAPAPAVKAQVMSDSEMDKVTAGSTVSVDNKGAFFTHDVGSGGQSLHRDPSNGFNNPPNHSGACFNCAF